MKILGSLKRYSAGIGLLVFLCGLCGLRAWALDQTTPTTSTQAKPAPDLSAPVDTKQAAPPSAEDLAKGDPGGTLTGTVNDVAVSDSKKGLTLGDAVNQIGQNKVAINFVWTLVAGFLVMFMQAGFAIVETGSRGRGDSFGGTCAAAVDSGACSRKAGGDLASRISGDMPQWIVGGVARAEDLSRTFSGAALRQMR